jgi:hypothetical protein
VSGPLLAYFGHHKAGSRWLCAILEALARDARMRYGCVSNPKWFDFDLASYVRQQEIEILAYTNADICYVDQLPAYRGFHVIRDPRDISVSAYFSHLLSHSEDYWPELTAHRARLSALPPDEGLLLDMEFTRTLRTDGFDLRPFEAMAGWDYTRPDTLEAKFETLVSDPVDGVTRLLAGLDLPVPVESIARTARAHTFEVLSGGREPGAEDPGSHYRHGVPGDWRRHFRQPHKDFFLANYPGLLRKLGYEKEGW